MTLAEKPQHLVALEGANAKRRRRAALLGELRAIKDPAAARERCAQLLEDLPEELVSSPSSRGFFIEDLLVCCHRVGRYQAAWLARRAEVSPRRLVGDLTERERDALAGELRGWRA